MPRGLTGSPDRDVTDSRRAFPRVFALNKATVRTAPRHASPHTPLNTQERPVTPSGRPASSKPSNDYRRCCESATVTSTRWNSFSSL